MALADDDWEEAPRRRDTERNRRTAAEAAAVADARLGRHGGPPDGYPQRMLPEQAGIGDPPRLARCQRPRPPAQREEGEGHR
jgi:hypothetical protein